MTPFDRREAEIEIAHCIASLREIVNISDDSNLLDKIQLGLSTIRREIDTKRREFRIGKVTILNQPENVIDLETEIV